MPRRDARPSDRLLRSLLATAVELAEAAGAELERRATRGPRRDVRRKGEGDFVTAVDVRLERSIRREIAARHPDHGFLGEESGASRPDARFQWVIDPIDGTSNFAQGLPIYAVAVACLHDRDPIAAAVWSAPNAARFAAARGLGAWFDGRRLRSGDLPLDDAAVVGAQWLRGAHESKLLRALAASGARVRVFGSTVTQICDVAAGRLLANVQTQGRIWDVAAPFLIAKEAGCSVTDWRGAPILPFPDLATDRHYPSLIAPPRAHARLRELLRGPSARTRR
ncbi:MAG: inositol monophosphatase [Planctomycetota bacterium]